MSIRLTIEYVKEYAKKFRYECLSKEYKNNYTKLKFRCDQNHIFKMRWNNFRQGQRCPYCAGNKKKTIEEVKEYAKKFNYECLSKEYNNCGTNLEFRCPEGHVYKVTWASFQQGKRCSICFGTRKKTIEEVKEYSKKFNYECLSNEYKNRETNLEFKCDKGHIFEIRWGDFQQGHRCPTCFRENYRGENCYGWRNYSEEDIIKLENYRASTLQLSSQNFHKYYYLINPNKLPRSKHKNHLDHIYTIIDGFKNDVPPEVIASPINLQMLTAFDNWSKNKRSDMSLETLYGLYNQFESEKGDTWQKTG